MTMDARYDNFVEALSSLVKTWRSALDDRFKPFGQSTARWQVILKLLRADQALAQCELALRVGIEPASLVRLLDALQGEGLVVRVADACDRRSKRVSLTEAGRELAREMGVIADQYRGEVLGSIEEAEMLDTTGVLQRLRLQIEQLGGAAEKHEVRHKAP